MTNNIQVGDKVEWPSMGKGTVDSISRNMADVRFWPTQAISVPIADLRLLEKGRVEENKPIMPWPGTTMHDPLMDQEVVILDIVNDYLVKVRYPNGREWEVSVRTLRM